MQSVFMANYSGSNSSRLTLFLEGNYLGIVGGWNVFQCCLVFMQSVALNNRRLAVE